MVTLSPFIAGINRFIRELDTHVKHPSDTTSTQLPARLVIQILIVKLLATHGTIDKTFGYANPEHLADANYYWDVFNPLCHDVLNTAPDKRTHPDKNSIFVDSPLLTPLPLQSLPSQFFPRIFDFLDGFTFSLNENDPHAITPEAIGIIFENYFLQRDATSKRQFGAYYTPSYFAHAMAAYTLGTWKRFNKGQPRIIDPCCGAGAFTMAMLHLLFHDKSVYPDASPLERKLTIIHSNLFHLDINGDALEIVQLRLWFSVINEVAPHQHATSAPPLSALGDNSMCCNALVDPCFNDCEPFDIVIGNPPYIGEKGNRELFDPVKDGPLKKFYAGRMDYFYFFFHLALNMCADNGVICFITTNYFTKALYGKKLRQDLQARSEIVGLINFANVRVFPSALSQHNCITLLRRTDTPSRYTTRYVSTHLRANLTPNLLDAIFNAIPHATTPGGQAFAVDIDSDDLFTGPDTTILMPPSYWSPRISTILHRMNQAPYRVGDLVDSRQGLVSGADTLKASRLADVAGGRVGEPIFCFPYPTDFPESKDLYKGKDIIPYGLLQPSASIVYTTSATPSKRTLDHLSRFTTVLSRRREVLNGRIPWWSLQWPRTPDVFCGPMIVNPKWVDRMTFTYVEGQVYGSADVYFSHCRPDSPIGLKTLVALLMSEPVSLWMDVYGKRKGDSLELTSSGCAPIPIPDVPVDTQRVLSDLVDAIQRRKTCHPADTCVDYQKKIDALSWSLYDIESLKK